MITYQRCSRIHRKVYLNQILPTQGYLNNVKLIQDVTHPEIPNSIPEKYLSKTEKHKAGGVADKYLENMLDGWYSTSVTHLKHGTENKLVHYQIAWIDSSNYI